MERLTLYGNGRAVGVLTAETRGLYTCFTASCPACTGVCRAYAVGEQGELRLGVLEPAGSVFRLCRSLSARECAAVGRLVRGEIRASKDSAEPVWQEADAPERLFRTPFLREQLRGVRGALTCRSGEEWLLALPLDVRGPFPLPGLFCLAAVRRIGAQEYAVFAFDRCERPVLP